MLLYTSTWYYAKCKEVTGYCYFYKLCHSIVFLVELQPPYDYGRGYKPVPQYPPEQRGYAPAPPVLSQQSNSVRPHLQHVNLYYKLQWYTGRIIHVASQARPNQPSVDRFQYYARGRKSLVTLDRFPCAHGMQ